MSDWSTLTSGELLVSLRVPTGWDLATATTDRVQVSGPEDDGFSTTLILDGGVAEEPGRAWFDDFADGVADHLVAQAPGLELRDVVRFSLSSMDAQVVMVTARRPPDDEVPALTQVVAWIWAGSDRMLVAGGSATTAREESEVPVLEQMIRSIRLLPARA